MKRIYSIAMLSALFLSSCGQADELNTSQTTASDFNSYVCFSVQNEVTDDELNEIAHIIENRAIENHMIRDYNLTPEYDTNSLRFEFDYIKDLSEHLVETITDKNILEFHKGNSIDGELLLTNENVKNAYSMLVDEGGDKNWCVMVELDETGSRIFADATGELAGTGTPISIWLDNELLLAPLISFQIIDGKVNITGNFTEQSSKELAEKINSMPLPYDVTIDTYEFWGAE